MNCLHVLHFMFLTFWLYLFYFFFHFIQSTLLLILLCMFLIWFSFFLNLVSALLHYLLPKGNGFFCSIVSAIVLLIAFVILVAKLSKTFSIVIVYLSGNRGRYSFSLTCNIFQFILAKLYKGCVNIDTHEIRLRVVSTDMWSELWSFSIAMWYSMILFIVYLFPYTKSIAVFLDRNVIVLDKIISYIPCWSIPSISLSAYMSYIQYYRGFEVVYDDNSIILKIVCLQLWELLKLELVSRGCSLLIFI